MSMRPLRDALLLSALMLGPVLAHADATDEAAKLFRDGDAAQALQLAEATIAAQPRDARMRFLKGMILTDLQRQAEAEQVFVALTEDFPELADPYNNLAVLYAGSGRLQAALSALQAALRNDPAHRTARENLGDVHLALAIEAWNEALGSDTRQQAELQRKLRLARDILPRAAASTSAPTPAAPRPPG